MSTDNPANFKTDFNALHAYEEPLDLSKRHHDKDIIKKSLKSLIQTRRLAEGKELLNITFTKQEPVAHELSHEELQKQQDRKEQNRKAAHKCRQKRKHKLEYFILEREKLKMRKKWLEQTLHSLEKEKDKLLHTLRTEGNTVIESGNTDQNSAAKNSTVISNSCLYKQNNTPHICCECEYLPKNQSHCDQKKFNKIKEQTSSIKNSCNMHMANQKSENDDRISFLNYYMKMNQNAENCSIETANMFQKSTVSDYFSDSDSNSSQEYLVIYESETDSSDMFSNSQSS